MTQVTIKNDHHEDYTYVFEPQALNAIKAALLINRPLLVKGETGSGKSQLAKAAAACLDRAFIPYVVSAKTEAQNLLWSFDAIARLADAQIEGALCSADTDKQTIRDSLALKNYIRPQALWIALNWQSAKDQFDILAKRTGQSDALTSIQNYEKAESNGVVVLIDEIDKADSSLPNGLLEVLGSNRFHPEGFETPVELTSAKGAPKPLVMVITNGEHPLPDAFLRRCLVVEVGLEAGGRKSQREQTVYLVSHAAPNFGKLEALNVSTEQGDEQSVLEAIAGQVIADRNAAKAKNIKPLVGQAEYFDLLRGIQALIDQYGGDAIDPAVVEQWIQTLARFTSQKGLQEQDKQTGVVDLPMQCVEHGA